MDSINNSKKKVLVIDDSFVNRTYLRLFLTAKGYHVIEAGNGHEAMDIITYEEPDIILLDLMMPEMDGLETMDELKKRGITIPVIIISADIQDSTMRKCLNRGAFCFIKKPVKGEDIDKNIKKALKINL